MDSQDRVVVITGASRGLGAGIAETLLADGLRVGVCARSAPALKDGDRVVATQVDVTDGDAVERFAASVVERFGRIDLWINNAGVLEPIGPMRDVESDAFRTHMDINVTGVFHGSRAFVRHVRSRDGDGVLINISSGAGRNPYSGWAAYCTSKAAVDMLTRVIDVEEREHGVRAHAVGPGIINTDMQALIRTMPAERFPLVDKFKQLEAEDAFTTADVVARKLYALAFGDTPLDTGEALLDLRV